jgi:hypothetical protein
VVGSNRAADEDYTREERIVLAGIRRGSGRTCVNCAWFVPKGRQRGCFPGQKYRKWLSYEEYGSGCELFRPKEDKK